MKILSIVGTRPEAIKMAPLVLALQQERTVQSALCVTAQHRGLLDPVIALFGLEPDFDLNIMQPNQSLNQLTSRLVLKMENVLEEARPDCVLVHGDTTTALACGLAAFHQGVPVGHVEAGLRTGDMRQPFPEEMNRCVLDMVSAHLFLPTETARKNAMKSGSTGHLWVTGNTVIDALSLVTKRLAHDAGLHTELERRHEWLDPSRRLLLVTGHRRENLGPGIEGICAALKQLAERDDIQIVYPIHPNPNIRGPVQIALGSAQQVKLIDPLEYLDFVWLMQRAHILLTDSGGLQEEGPFLGKPVLVMRDVTERPEAIAAGTAKLVGTEPRNIVANVELLLSNEEHYQQFSRKHNPYGDGLASHRIIDALCGRPVAEFEFQDPI